MKSRRPALARSLALALPGLLLAGCATPGPLHLYTVSAERPQVIRDHGPDGLVDVPSFVGADETLTGLAYDPYTDHLFLRLAPGNRIRVVDRPSRRIKREFVIEELPVTGGGDLAVRPRDGHLFFVIPHAAALIETNRFGRFVRRIELTGYSLNGPVVGVAYDPARQLLWILENSHYPQLHTYRSDGSHVRWRPAGYEGARGHLAFDPEKKQVYIAAVFERIIAILNDDGEIQGSIPAPDGDLVRFIDAGPRSFVRVF